MINRLLRIVILLLMLSPLSAFGAGPMVAGGTAHSILLKNDGTLWGWGLNTGGQLGLGDVLNRAEPARIGTGQWSAVSAGGNHTVAIKTDGTLWAWGDNQTSPQSVSALTTWVSVSAGPDFNMAIKSDGTLWTWGGLNNYGQSGLGAGHSGTQVPLSQVGSDSDWALVSAGDKHCLALKKDGSLWAWGYNTDSRLGDGTTANSLAPKHIGIDTDWVSILAGTTFSFGIKSDGYLWAWGNNSSCNFGSCGSMSIPTKLTSYSNVWAQLMPGALSGHAFALRKDGSLCAWGNNSNGQLGNGTIVGNMGTNFQLVDSETNWAGAAAGGSHTVALKLNNAVFSWGGNSSGQLGYWTDSTFNAGNQLTLRLVTPHRLAGGDTHSLAVAPDGTLWSWGSNTSLNGQLGLGGTVQQALMPTQIGSDSDWVAAAAGGVYSLALKSDGTLWEWGFMGSISAKNVPTKIGSDTDWVDMVVGGDHALALKSNGKMYSWGSNNTGQIGNGSTQAQSSPVLIGSSQLGVGQTWLKITAGSGFSGAIRSDGALCTWGDNSSAQSGDGGNAGGYSTWPYCMPVPYNTFWQSITAGAGHMLASKRYNDFYYNYVDGWGLNFNGQLGMGPINPTAYPPVVDPTLSPTNIDFFGPSAGKVSVKSGANANHSFALHQNGSMWGWGDNTYGQIGNSSNPMYSMPIAGAWATVAVGSDHSLAQKSDGTLYAWGSDIALQLGTSSYGNKYIPTEILATVPDVSVRFTSNNSKTDWAKVGDTVTLAITSNNIAIPRPVVRIAGHTVLVSGSGKSWNASYTMTASDTDGVIPVSVRYTDAFSGVSYPERTQTSINPNVTYDKTPPVVDALYKNSTATEADNSLTINYSLNQLDLHLSGHTTDSSNAQINCSWSQIGSTPAPLYFTSPNSCDTYVRSTSDGNYLLRLTATDQAGNSVTSDLSLTWDSTLPTFKSVSISSNNAFNPTYVKEDETITLNFTTSEPIQTPIGYSITILGNAVVATGSGTAWSAQLTVKGNGSYSASSGAVVPFAITITDLAGNITSTNTITSGGNVILDITTPHSTQVSIASTNANPKYAKVGDTINLTIFPSETVLPPVVTIAGHAVPPTVRFGGGWTASYVMTSQDTEGPVSFSIAPVIDPAGHISTDSTLTGTTDVSSVTFDRSAPTVSITTPATNAMDIAAPTDIIGTARDNFILTKVEIQVSATPPNDGIFRCLFLNGMSQLSYGSCPGGSAPWLNVAQIGTLGAQVNGTTTWSINVNNLFSSYATYTVNIRAFDSANNQSPVTTSTFTRIGTAYGTKLYATPLSTVLLSNTGTTTVQGQLTLQDSTITGVSLINQPITVTVKDAVGAPVTGSPFSGSTTDSAGHFSISGIGNITLPGTYKLQAHFSSAITAGAGLTSSDSPEYTITVGSQPGYAIIVQGRITTGEGVQAHARTANRIYKTLKDRGFQASNIKYLGPSAINPDSSTAGGVALESTTASPQSIQSAIAWAKGQISSSPAPFYLIMVDHGVNGVFRIDSGNTVVNITPQTLNSWLAVMDDDLTVKNQKQVIMIGSCYSGSFIDSLKNRPGRVIITSAAANEESYKGPLEPLAQGESQQVRSGEYFLDALFHELKIGYSVTSAFRTAAGKTRDFTRQGWSLSANSLYGDNSVQHPLLDDTGDGIGVNQLSDQNGDGAMAATMYLGIGDTKTNAAEPGEILSITSTDTLPNGTSFYTLWLQHIVGSQGSDNAVSAWAEVRRPDVIIPSQQNQVTEQVALNLDTVPLTISNSLASGDYNLFTTPGKYEIFYYTRKQSGAISEVRRSVIYKKDVSGTGPKQFQLLAPPNGNTAQKTNGIIFNWAPTTDGDSNPLFQTPVNYTLIVCDNPSFNGSLQGAYYRKIEELADTFAKLDKSDGIVDSRPYFWKVIASDLYGNTTESPSWSFTVNDNTNVTELYFYKGTVLDADTKTPLSGATVTSSAASWTTITNGRYLVFSDLTGPSDITASYPGYKDAIISVEPIFSTSGTNYVDNTFYLISNTPLLTLNFDGNGEGSVNGEISCMKGGSCPAIQLAADSPVTLTPSPVTTSSVFSGWSGACTNPTGICSFTMKGAKTVTAAFSLAPKIKLDLNATSGYNIFTDAYSNSIAFLYSMNATLSEDWTLAAGKAITLIGGYQADYLARTGYTVLNGKLSIQSGKLQVDGLKVR